jgi:hypothetical protein
MIDMSVKAFRRCLVVVAALLAISMGSAPAHAEIPQKVRDALTASSPKVRIVAASQLAKVKDPEVRGLLEKMLRDDDAAVRASVVEALGRVGDPASVPALEALQADDSKTVQAVLARVLPVLVAARVVIFIGKGEDYSGAATKYGDLLRTKTMNAIKEKLGPAYLVQEDATKKAFGASPIAIRSVTQRADGPNTFVDVKCELTLVEMPQNNLRAALSTTASVGVGGKVTAKLEAELTRDAIDACAPELASDFASYVRERSRR